ncbi:MAG: FAD-dependent oxidoreductase [Myxococcota bacterium]|jgi:succinate dehydrogenase/fumarate reductase flavoprotein subunit|nr:FAD-dependent oxidoreductase [Myxococcota bacterium]
MSSLRLDPRDVSEWHEEVDILVVGLGVAGAAAALEATSLGAETLVVERGGGGGGTSAMSGGVIYMGGGTPLQRSCGFEDSADEMFEYLMASCGDNPDEAKVRLYCDGSVEQYDWLVGHGVPFKQTYYHGTSGEPPTDDGLVWSGAEQVHPFCEIAKPAPRGHVPQVEHQGGPLLMKVLCAEVEACPAETWMNARCTALYQEADGHVVGAVIEVFGEARNVRARKGVVVTTGGFVLNDEMLEHHAPLAKRCAMRVAADGDDGSGINLGVAAGAATMNMSAVSISMPITQPWGLKRGVLVNAQGQRFVNEDTYYGRLGGAALLHNDGRAWLIVDDEVFEKPTYMEEIAAVGESFAELEAELGLAPGALDATMSLYNRHAEKGEDPVFHKGRDYLEPLTTPPFGAFDCTTEHALYAAFTLGGLRTDTESRVLDPTGAPIPGLFAAGRATSGLSVGGYSSGLSLGDGIFFGRRAARTANARQADPTRAPR